MDQQSKKKECLLVTAGGQPACLWGQQARGSPLTQFILSFREKQGK